MYGRIMQLVIPLIMGMFLIVGLVLLWAIQANGRETLAQTQRVAVSDIVSEVHDEIQQHADVLVGITDNRDARDFARDTLVNISGSTVETTQERLLGDFVNLLEQNPEYLAIRYVTFNGSVWSEVTNYDDTIPRADARIRLGIFANDPALLRSLAVNPGEVVVSDITFELDPDTLDPATPISYLRLASPVAPDSNFATNIAGVIEIDMKVDPVLAAARSAADAQLAHQTGRRVVVTDQSGNLLYDTADPKFDYLGALGQQQSIKLDARYPAAEPMLASGSSAATANVSGENVFSTSKVGFGSNSTSFWMAALIDKSSETQSTSNLIALIALVGSLMLGFSLTGLVGGVLRRTLRPIGEAQAVVERWTATGTISSAPSALPTTTLVAVPTATAGAAGVEHADGTEVGLLLQSFHNVTDRISTLQHQLDSQQGRYNRNMDIAARIGRETATLYDLDELLNRAIELICNEFDFYHAQVFLIDDIGENAVLAYSRGEVGQRLLETKHKLAVGSESVIGRVTQAGTSVIVNDTLVTDVRTPHTVNPLLPDTRAEMALPLQIGERIIGALDVQSKRPNSFQSDEIRTLQILADQIAVAIQNVRLLVQSEERVTQINALNRQLTRSAWEETSRRSALAPIYRYDLLTLRHDESDVPPNVSLPIAIRGEIVGSFDVSAPEGEEFTEGDRSIMQAVADRVAVAIENARLFEENVEALTDNQRLLQVAEDERERLSSILESLPAGVLVLDPQTFEPLQHNQQVEQMLGRAIQPGLPFSVEAYQLHRSGTDALYPTDNLPIFTVAQSKTMTTSDDISVALADGRAVDLLVNAVPVLDENGEVRAIVAAFQDISTLRNLERTLEANLRETVSLYESARALSEAGEVDDILDQVLFELSTQGVDGAYVLLLDDKAEGVRVARSLDGEPSGWTLPSDILDAQNPMFIPSVSEAPELDDATRLALLNQNVAALVSLPMRARSRRGAPLGWSVITFAAPQDITPELEQFLTTLNDNAAVALDNRYLFESTEEALQETAALYGATTNLSRARTAEDIGEAVHLALETLVPDMYGAYLLNDDGMMELFNISLDAAPLDFLSLIEKHHLLATDANVFIDDLRTVTDPTPFEQELIALGNIRSVAVVQLRTQGRPSGVFFVIYNRPHRFDSGDSRYLNSVADSASVVVNNYLLLEQIQESLEETSILYQASRALNDAATPEEILDVIVNHLTNRPISQAFIAVLSTENWDNPKAIAQVVASWQREGETGIDLSGINLVADQYPAWRLLASPNIITIDSVSTSDQLDDLERVGVESLELQSISVLPLRVAGRSVGAIVIGGSDPHRHNDRDLRIYRSLAEQAALRMEAIRLLDQTERRARQLATSAEVSQIASSILDLNDLLPRIVNLIRETFGYDHAQIFLMDDADDFAVLRASTGEAGQQLISIQHKLQKGSPSVIGQVTASGDPTIASDTADARVVHRPNPYLPNTRSEMAIPLMLKGRVVGALDVQSNQPNAFDDDDISVLQTLAAQISVAIDNAELFEESRSRANEMTFLFNVTTAAASAETLTEALQNVASELLISLDAISASIYLPQTYVDPEGEEFIMLEPVALAGSEQPLSELSEVRLDAQDNLLAEVGRSRRPIIIDNISREPNYLSVVDNANSAVIVPLTSGNRLVGLSALESDEFNAYDSDTLTLLLTLSGTLSAIVQSQQLLEQVQATNEQLRELDRLKSDFLANMSHELRTPLNSIIGFSRVILKGIDGPLTEMQEQDLTTIYNSGQHLLNLINDILDQAKIAAGKMDLQFDYFEMKAVVDGVRSIGIGLVKDKPIDIFVDIAPGLEQVYGDEFRTRQVLINLVSNAAKFTREGAITLSTYPVMDEESGRMMIRTDVTDTGIGIADADIHLLFEAFRQVDSSLTRTQGGTGLGLPISKSLVEMQGGRMEVSSQVNVGSTFSIFMPVEPVVEEEEKPKKKTDDLAQPPRQPVVTGPLTLPNGASANSSTTQQNESPVGVVHATKRQILLIEDNPDLVDQYRRALQREGFDIFTASIPLEAEAMASGLHPTLIIMDVSFSGGQGWDILGKLKARDDTFDIPVIVVTLSIELERANEMGAFRFIQRPFTPEDLVLAVRDAERESRINRILIIDDQPESVRLLTNLLDEQGQYRVFSAANGAEGIALVARRRPDLVILDLRMPEMDGFQVVKELRNNPETATIPILVVTGDTLSTDERDQLMNLAVLHKADISAEQYHQFVDGVRGYLNGD